MISRAIAAALLLLSATAGAQTLRVRVVDQAGKPIPDAVVYAVDVAKPAAAGAPVEAVMEQSGFEFHPHILAVRAGTTVRFPNKDPLHHSLYSFSKAKHFDLPLYKGQDAAPVTFDQPGVVRLGCNIHDWMTGYVVVVPDAAFALTDAQGNAALPRPRSGSLTVWSERLQGEAPKLDLARVKGGQALLRIQARGPIKPPPHHPVDAY